MLTRIFQRTDPLNFILISIAQSHRERRKPSAPNTRKLSNFYDFYFQPRNRNFTFVFAQPNRKIPRLVWKSKIRLGRCRATPFQGNCEAAKFSCWPIYTVSISFSYRAHAQIGSERNSRKLIITRKLHRNSAAWPNGKWKFWQVS